MIYSKAKLKDHKRPPKRKSKLGYAIGDLIVYYIQPRPYDSIEYGSYEVNKTFIVEHVSGAPQYFLCSADPYSHRFYVSKEQIIGKINPNNKLLRLVNE